MEVAVVLWVFGFWCFANVVMKGVSWMTEVLWFSIVVSCDVVVYFS